MPSEASDGKDVDAFIDAETFVKTINKDPKGNHVAFFKQVLDAGVDVNIDNSRDVRRNCPSCAFPHIWPCSTAGLSCGDVHTES